MKIDSSIPTGTIRWPNTNPNNVKLKVLANFFHVASLTCKQFWDILNPRPPPSMDVINM